MINTNQNPTRYEVTKTFTSGLLAGLTITETTSVKFVVGFRCEKYVVVAVQSCR